jgi:hypothetical protein
VIDSGEFLAAPEAHLRALCERLEIDFLPDMLHWPSGPRASDGVWAKYWYDSVWRSTGFATPRPRRIQLSGRAAEVAEACQPMYERLHQQRIGV